MLFTHFRHHNKTRNLPVKSNFVPKFLLIDISVQEVVADVGGRPFHPLDEDLPLRHIEVVLQKGPRVLTLPVKLLSNVTPKFCEGNGQSSSPRNRQDKEDNPSRGKPPHSRTPRVGGSLRPQRPRSPAPPAPLPPTRPASSPRRNRRRLAGTAPPPAGLPRPAAALPRPGGSSRRRRSPCGSSTERW